ncbi:unnamed protein product [Meganyctiphanes norvegica]|uniref:Beta/gamma crystallin 'Greek key' domain-containing protein n=1 Tax=Meganyctiphanes norvegica TaxID=48144 RepID=A0AAV2SPH1_MEGNR
MLQLFNLAIGQTDPPNHYLELYTGTGQGGASATVVDYNHDLSSIGFDDLTESICGKGVWIYYENTNYNNTHHHGWTQVFASGSYSCEDIPETRRNQISSVRYAGTGDLYDETLTIYHSHNYGGGEVMFIREEPYLGDYNNEGSSLIITGESPWTVYSHPGFTGDAICLQPHSIGGDYSMGSWNVDDIGMPNNEISSIQKGCMV